jgi:hypothetical protein
VVVHPYNFSTQEAEVGGSRAHGQPGLHGKFQVTLGYIARPCLKKCKKERRKGGREREEERTKRPKPRMEKYVNGQEGLL